MSTITIRSSDDQLAQSLKLASQKQGLSINKLILDALNERFGSGAKMRRFSDLDHLAGTWSEDDLLAFNQAAAGLRQVNKADWA